MNFSTMIFTLNHTNIELTTLEKLSDYISRHWGIEIKNCFHAYVDMKKQKGESRTYFLDELSRRLNERMQQDDEKGLSLSGN